ncbi:MAG: 2-oxo acid dehydrogenase subunit E2 [Solirubrobacteraceae bacterium]
MTGGGPKGETQVVQPTAVERTIARRVAEARATIPHLELSVDLASDGALDTARLVRACALALREHPRANGAYRDGQFELYSRINIGLVMADEDRYLIPTLFDADEQTLEQLEEAIGRLAAQAAGGQLGAPTFSGATFTVWNAGEHSIARASIPIVPPQAAALAAGTGSLTLACDHRMLYGALAARFLNSVKQRLEAGEP